MVEWEDISLLVFVGAISTLFQTLEIEAKAAVIIIETSRSIFLVSLFPDFRECNS